MNEAAVWIAVGGLILNLLIFFLGIKRANDNLFHRVEDKFDKNIEERRQEMLRLQDKLESDVDDIRRQFGETIMAVREKITQTELWNRDNFVNNRTFNTVVADIRRIEDKIDSRFNMLEGKLEKFLGPAE